MGFTPAQLFVLAVMAQYVAAAALYAYQGRYGFALAYAAYALGNVGLLMADKGI